MMLLLKNFAIFELWPEFIELGGGFGILYYKITLLK